MRFRQPLCLFISSLLLFANARTNAQWLKNDEPYGAHVTSVVTSEANLFAGTYNGGVFVSDDHGSSWLSSSEGLTNLHVIGLVVNDGGLFAGTWGGGVFRTSNNGSSWTPAGLDGKNVRAMATSNNYLFVATTEGAFFSDDYGDSWSEINTGLTYTDLESLIVNGNTVYATCQDGIFVTTNNGALWTSINSDLTDVSVLAFDGNKIFAGTTVGRMLRSPDSGATWSLLDSDFGISVNTLLVMNSTVYAGTAGGGIYKTSDDGDNWDHANDGLANIDITRLVADGVTIWAATGSGGIFNSTDEGSSWTAFNSGLSVANILTLKSFGTNLYAGTGGSGAFISTDDGSTWTAINNGLQGNFVSSFAQIDNNLFASTNGQGVWTSLDNGDSWAWANNLLTNQSITSLASIDNKLFAGTRGDGVFMTENNGASWTEMNARITSTHINCLATHESNLFAGTVGEGIFISPDQGLTWNAINSGLSNLDINAFAFTDDKMFVAIQGDGVYYSDDNGTSWSAVNTGLTNLLVTTLLIEGENLYAGTHSGVFSSGIDNVSWQHKGLTDIEVNTLVVSNGKLLAGTFAGLYYQNLNLPLAKEATDISSTGFTANWTSALAATEYQLDVSIDNFATLLPDYNSIVVTDTHQPVTGLLPGTSFQYRVRGASASFVSENSGPVLTTTNKAEQLITFNSLSPIGYGATPFALTATTSSGLPISYTSSNTDVATINENTLTVIGVGSTMITASQNGNGSFNPATQSEQLLTVNKGDQSIEFNSLSPVTYGAASFALTATTSSGLPVSYTSSNANVATISGNVMTIIRAGTTTITASQSGNENFKAALNIDQSLIVNKASQSIEFTSFSPVSHVALPISLTATASSGLPVSYTSSNAEVAKVNGNVLTILKAGSTIITAYQEGNENYSAAPGAPQALSVYSRVINFLGTNVVHDTLTFGRVTLGAKGSSKLKVFNAGNSPLTITKIDYPSGFLGDQTSGIIAPADTLTLALSFTPTILSKTSGKIAFVTDATAGPSQLFATGIGVVITGTEENPNELAVYPNPSSSIIWFNGIYKQLEENPIVQIIDAVGRSKGFFPIGKEPADKYRLDISSLDSGLYLLLIGNTSVKVMKE